MSELEISPMNSVRHLRFGGNKVRTGCSTCKLRRVKCDEGRPSCQRCIKARRQCSGYGLPPPNRTEKQVSFVIYTPPPQPSRSPSPYPGLNTQERRYYDFFRFRTAVELTGPYHHGIWNTIILQAADSESAITHAVIALGALHESFGSHQDAHAATSAYAVQHYNKAIEQIIGLDLGSSADRFDVVLMTSILFAAFESLRGNIKLSLTHIASGANILAEIDPKTGNLRKGSLSRNLFVPTFTRLENQLHEIDEKAPGPNIKSLPMRPLPSLPERFTTICESEILLNCFMNCLWRFFATIQVGDSSDESLDSTYQRLMTYFSKWCLAFEQSGFPKSDPAVLILRPNMLGLELFKAYSPGNDEMFWDSFDSEFENILDSVDAFITSTSSTRPEAHDTPEPHSTRAPTFTFTLGIINPLYLVCARCRDPLIRRRALYMLSHCNRKEGIKDSAMAASIAERLMLLEESNAIVAPVTNCSQIPASARVSQADIFLGTGREGRIAYRTGMMGIEEPLPEAEFQTFVW